VEEDILALVYAAIDDVNAQAPDGAVISKGPDTPLLGGAGGVDSLTFVNLIVALEEQIQSRLGQLVVLVDENSMALQEHPFRSVDTLAHYVEKIVLRQPPNGAS
jgi:acyl carrier protein